MNEDKPFDRETRLALLKALARGYFEAQDFDILSRYNPENPLARIRKTLNFDEIIDTEKAEL